MIGTIDVAAEAKSPNLPLYPWTAYVNSPSSIRVRNVPKKIGSWCITRVYVSVVYPDGQIKTADCVPVGGVYVGTVAGAGVSGTTENGYVIMADGVDENGDAVTGYVLGRGNVTILDDDGILQPDAKRYYVRMLSAESETHYEGDLYPTESGYVIWQNGQENLLGTPFEQITAYVDSAISSKADLSAIPSNTSQLSNDSGFITAAQVPTPDKIEDLSANVIYANRTVQYIEEVANWTDAYHPDDPLNLDAENNWWIANISPSFYMKLQFSSGTWTLEIGENVGGEWVIDSGSVQDAQEATQLTFNISGVAYVLTKGVQQVQTTGELALKSDLPTKTSDLTNDSGFITSADIIIKRDLNDFNVYVDPMVEHASMEVTVWHTSVMSTLYILNWDESSQYYYYTDGSTNIQIYFDGYSSAYIITGSIQDMGGTQRNINEQFDLTSPLWSVTLETQYFYKIEIASIKAHIATKEYVDSRLSALEARIAALEGN